ncbi:MAG: hypothetical protein ACRDD1_02755, partial [Planctomycetia bacterium]
EPSPAVIHRFRVPPHCPSDLDDAPHGGRDARNSGRPHPTMDRTGRRRTTNAPRRLGVVLLLAVCTIGCAQRSRGPDDPFRSPFSFGKSKAKTGGSGDTGGGRGSDPFYDDARPDGPLASPAGRAADPAKTADAGPPSTPPLSIKTPPAFPMDQEPALRNVVGRDDAPDSSEKAAALKNLRRRLDEIGAVNMRLETDAKGENTFRCELPIPNQPDLFHVIEAHHPDTVKAMTAVTEAAEKWRKEQDAKSPTPAPGR